MRTCLSDGSCAGGASCGVRDRSVGRAVLRGRVPSTGGPGNPKKPSKLFIAEPLRERQVGVPGETGWGAGGKAGKKSDRPIVRTLPTSRPDRSGQHHGTRPVFVAQPP